jgi:nonsense-mediated mRNA decay protein 3
VKCGKDCDESLDGMCIDCWLDGRRLASLPHHVDLRTCVHCGEFLIDNRWVDCGLEMAVRIAAVDALETIREVSVDESGTEVDVEEQDPQVYVAHVRAPVRVMDYETAVECSTIVRIKNSVCKPCSRRLGNYYTAIVQVRSGSKDLDDGLRDEVLSEIEGSVSRQEANNRHLFITKIEAVPGGADVYLSSISLGRAVAKEISDAYGAETRESPKLVGKTDDGQDLYRVTYLIRLPEFHVGDVIQFEGRYYKLVRLTGAGGRIMDLSNFKERTVRRTDMDSFKVYEKRSGLREATVVSSSGGEIQVLRPDNYAVADLRVPEGFEPGEAVKTVSIDDVLYLVP